MSEKKRNPKWSRDEIILALDLYFRLNGKGENDSNEEVATLSRYLQLLSPVESRTYINYRNSNAVTLKLQNLRHYDQHRRGGMPGGSKQDEAILIEFYQNREQLQILAQGIIKSLEYSLPESFDFPDENASAPEGRRLQRLHFYIERNGSLVDKKKRQELKKKGKLECEACQFNFEKSYGPLGHGFIEAHHIIPLAHIMEVKLTNLSDYILLCSNCHRMIHKIKDCELSLLKKAIEAGRSQTAIN